MIEIETLDRLASDVEVLETAKECIQKGSTKLYNLFPILIKVIIEDGLWKNQVDRNKKPFKTFIDFALYPGWHGLEIESIDRLLDYCKYNEAALKVVRNEIPPLLKHGGIGSNQFKLKDSSRGRHTTLAKKPLRGSAYFIARLKRDHPIIAAKLANEEYPSVRQAVIAAGIIKVKTPLETVQDELQKLTIAECVSIEQSIEKVKHSHIKQKKYTKIEKKQTI